MTAVITLDDAKERIRRLAEERPDFVYEPIKGRYGNPVCLYFDPAGEPSCIVGHALADELRKAGVNYMVELSIEGLAYADYAVDIDPAAADFLTSVQSLQDRGTPWGEAYRLALQE